MRMKRNAQRQKRFSFIMSVLLVISMMASMGVSNIVHANEEDVMSGDNEAATYTVEEITSEDETSVDIVIDLQEKENIEIQAVTLPNGIKQEYADSEITANVTENGTADFTIEYREGEEEKEVILAVEVDGISQPQEEANVTMKSNISRVATTISPASWEDVQSAIDGASAGDTIDLSGLSMRNPSPKEDFTSRLQFVVNKDLTITAGATSFETYVYEIKSSQYMNIELQNNATLTLSSIAIEGGQSGIPTIRGEGNVVLGEEESAVNNTLVLGYGSRWTVGEKNSPAINVTGDVTVGAKASVRGGQNVINRSIAARPPYPIADDTTGQAAIVSKGKVTVNGGNIQGGHGIFEAQNVYIGGEGIIAKSVVINSGTVQGGNGNNDGADAIVADDVTLYTGTIKGGNGLNADSSAGVGIRATTKVASIGATKSTLMVQGGSAKPRCARAIECDGDVTMDGGAVQGGTVSSDESISGSAIKVSTGTIRLSGDANISQATGMTKTCEPVIDSNGDVYIGEGVLVRTGSSGVYNNHPHEPSGHLLRTTGTVIMTGGELQMYPFENATDNGSIIVGAKKFVMSGGKLGTTDHLKYKTGAFGAPAIKDVETVEISGTAQVNGLDSSSRFSSSTDYTACPAGPAISGGTTVTISGDAVVTGGKEVNANAYTPTGSPIKSGGDAIVGSANVTIKGNAQVIGGAQPKKYLNGSRAGEGVTGVTNLIVEDNATISGGAAELKGYGGNGISNTASITLSNGSKITGGTGVTGSGMGIKMRDNQSDILIARGTITGGGTSILDSAAAIGNVNGTVFVDGDTKANASIVSKGNAIQMGTTGLTIVRNGSIDGGIRALSGGKYYLDVTKDYQLQGNSNSNQLFAIELERTLLGSVITPAAVANTTAPDGTEYVLFDDGTELTITATSKIFNINAQYHRATSPAGGEYTTIDSPETVLSAVINNTALTITMPADDIRLNADNIEHTVNFESNGGSAVDSITANKGATITEPTAPTKDGEEFAGWYKDEALTEKWDFTSDTVMGDMTLYAKWNKIEYTVNFESNGGSTVDSITANQGATITEPTAPTKDGEEFVGWYKDEALTEKWDFASDTVTGDMTLYAKWNKIEYTVNFESNGGSAVDSITANQGANITEPTAPTKEGEEFAGWYKDEALTEKWNFTSDTVMGDMTLYAKWNKIEYTVNFESNGGSAVDSITANQGATITEPTAPTKEGEEFVGWYKDEALTEKWDFASGTVMGDMTLYAKWNKADPLKPTPEEPTKEEPTKTDETTKTGDTSYLMIYMLFAGVAFTGIVALTIIKRKSKKNS